MNSSKSAYFITCLLSGMVELGTVFWGISCKYSMIGVLGLAMAYQLGNVLRFFIDKKLSALQTPAIGVTVGISILLFFIKDKVIIAYSCTALLLLIFSTFLQNIRSAVQGDIPRWQKRSCRVLGFVLSFLFYSYGAALWVAATVALLYYSVRLKTFYYDEWIKNWKKGIFGRRICWSMVTHQAHYFVYNYIMLALVVNYFNNAIFAALWFAANWIPYTITEPLIQKLKWDKWYVIAITAHIFNSLVLLGMFISIDVSMITALCLWVLTGFGGGNVFCIRKALAPNRIYDKDVWNFSEQIGHILGVGTALLIAVSGLNLTSSMLFGMFYALLTVPVLMLSHNNRG